MPDDEACSPANKRTPWNKGSRHATRLVLACGRLQRVIKRIKRDLEKNAVPAPMLRRIARSVGQPVRLGVKIEKGQLVIYDKIRNLNFLMTAPLY